MQPLNMAVIVTTVMDRMALVIQDAGAEVLVPPAWPVALGYPSWVEEVWANYISNAVKYGGHPPRVELGATAEGGQVRFWVRDNGSGLTAEEQGRLFQPFERLGTQRATGHGLGTLHRSPHCGEDGWRDRGGEFGDSRRGERLQFYSTAGSGGVDALCRDRSLPLLASSLSRKAHSHRKKLVEARSERFHLATSLRIVTCQTLAEVPGTFIRGAERPKQSYNRSREWLRPFGGSQ